MGGRIAKGAWNSLWLVRLQRASPVIRVQCPACGHAFDFADYLAGLTAICKNCTHRIPVPTSSKSLESGKDAVKPDDSPSVQERPAENMAPAPGSIQPTPAVAQPPLMAPLTDKLPEARSIRKTSTAPPPEWAVERVKAMLALGEPIPTIVDRLVAKGLSSESASTAIDLVLEEQVRPAMTRVRSAERFEAANRWLAVSVAVATVIFASFYFSQQFVVFTAFRLAIPVACIWFAEALGHGISFFHPIRNDVVRSILVRLPAWLWLIAIVARTISLAIILSDG
jgi:hypothetical protein